MFFDSINKKSSKFDFIDGPILPTKRKNPNCKTMSKYFMKGGEFKRGESITPDIPKKHFRGIYYEVPDVMINFTKNCFKQPSFKIFSC